MKDQKRILSTYDAQSAKLSAQYQSVQTEDVLAGLKPRLKRQRALDIACGNGRDAKWLAQQGFVVDAIDGAPGMIREAQTMNPHENVTYSVDLMPDLQGIRASGQKYDLMVMSAAWMHLEAPARARMFQTLCDLANPGAMMFITLRHGPAPEDRPMYAVSAEELRDMAADFLVHFEHITDGKADKLGRGDVWWDSVSLKMPEHHVDALPVYRDGIIHAAKNTSYKLGFAHCFIDLIRNRPGLLQEADDTRYAVPLGPMLPQWIRLYDGLAEAGLAQIRPNRKLADPLNATRRFATAAQGLAIADFKDGAVFEGLRGQAALKMMNIARSAIVQDGPVRFITRPGGQHPVFTYVPPAVIAPERTLILNNDSLKDRFGTLLVAKDLVRAGRDYAPLIDAGVMREWVRFNGHIAGLDAAGDTGPIKSSLEKVMKFA
jgi:SAM-dependent methyltransferase